ncbi:MAG TPA: hypothetical protein VFB54_04935 [Burkholderiales bacterium]|nr:hypothetical protein [Burkholderiales bacterium]
MRKVCTAVLLVVASLPFAASAGMVSHSKYEFGRDADGKPLKWESVDLSGLGLPDNLDELVSNALQKIPSSPGEGNSQMFFYAPGQGLGNLAPVATQIPEPGLLALLAAMIVSVRVSRRTKA